MGGSPGVQRWSGMNLKYESPGPPFFGPRPESSGSAYVTPFGRMPYPSNDIWPSAVRVMRFSAPDAAGEHARCRGRA